MYLRSGKRYKPYTPICHHKENSYIEPTIKTDIIEETLPSLPLEVQVMIIDIALKCTGISNKEFVDCLHVCKFWREHILKGIKDECYGVDIIKKLYARMFPDGGISEISCGQPMDIDEYQKECDESILSTVYYQFLHTIT